MKRYLVTIVCLSLFAGAAQAEPVIQFYFSKMSCEEAEAYSFTPPPEYGDGTLPAVASGEKVYLWTRTKLDQPWNSVSLYFTDNVTGGDMIEDSRCCCGAKCWVYRWEADSDFDPATDDSGSDGYDDIYLYRGNKDGIGADYYPPFTVWEDETFQYQHICLGSMTWGTPGYQRLSNDVGLILRNGYTTSELYFGFNPDGTPEYAGPGETAHTTSTRADIYIAPGPCGDLNCDGSINSLDIDPFVLVVAGTPPDYPEYYAQHPDCNHTMADCSADGSINSLDIDPFVGVLTGR